MKKFLLFVVGIVSMFAMQSFSSTTEYKVNICSQVEEQSRGSVVYVSTGGYGKRYHNSVNCRGLSRASGVAKMDKGKAVDRGLTPCKICY